MHRESCIPGYDEALARERQLREDAFVSDTISICGVRIKHVTPKLLAILFRIESPFIVGGEYTALEALRFLWVLSVDFKPDEEARVAFNVKAMQAISATPDELFAEIDEYVEATFFDAPGGTGATGVPYVCSTAWMVYKMACEPFKWDEARTLDSPIRRIYQYLKCEKFANGDALRNSISDKLKEDWLAELRKQLGQN